MLNIPYKNSREIAAESLGKIAQGNPEAIAALIRYFETTVETTEDQDALLRAVHNLIEIDPGNSKVITALIRILKMIEDKLLDAPPTEKTNNKYTILRAVQDLSELHPGNSKVITALIRILKIIEDKLLDTPPTEFPSHLPLVECFRMTDDEEIFQKTAETLGKITQGNSDVIKDLIRILETTRNAWSRFSVAETLEQIAQGNLEAIAALIHIIETTENEETRRRSVDTLGKIAQGNSEAIAALIHILEITRDKATLEIATESLQKIITTPEQYAGVVSALKDGLSEEVYQGDFDLFNKCYEIIWICAKNLSYPEFYQAWHHPSTTPYPKLSSNSRKLFKPLSPSAIEAFLSDTSQLPLSISYSDLEDLYSDPPDLSQPSEQLQNNLALLPQILNQAIQTHPVNCQPICIDGSRFSDPSNPALQIYTTLKKAGCPPSPDGKPRTIAELQAYCEDDLSDHPIALILYEEPTDPPPQGFDMAVLNQLARFSHPPIAVVVPQPLPDCRLPQFLESDPDLMATLLQWLQNLDR
ncbi:MAG: HEAT repeat domain-containing protein [Planktothrix sp.]